MDDESGVLWLRDLLPRQFPNARILTFGYDADTVNLSEVSHLTLNNHGTSLIVELLRLRGSLEVNLFSTLSAESLVANVLECID